MSLAFMNIGTQEMVLIVIVALVLFGGKKLPEIARGLGRGIREFKDASDDIKREISDQINNFEKDLDTTVEDKSDPQHATIAANIAGEISDRAETDGQDEENKAYPAFSTPENTYPHHPGEQPSSGDEHHTYGYNN